MAFRGLSLPPSSSSSVLFCLADDKTEFQKLCFGNDITAPETGKSKPDVIYYICCKNPH